MKQCKECKHGKYRKQTDTVGCRTLNRELLVNRAETCTYYEDSATIKKLKEKGKYEE